MEELRRLSFKSMTDELQQPSEDEQRAMRTVFHQLLNDSPE